MRLSVLMRLGVLMRLLCVLMRLGVRRQRATSTVFVWHTKCGYIYICVYRWVWHTTCRYMYVCTRMCKCTHIYICVYIWVWHTTCGYIYVCTRMCIHVPIFTYACTYECDTLPVDTYTYACMYVNASAFSVSHSSVNIWVWHTTCGYMHIYVCTRICKCICI